MSRQAAESYRRQEETKALYCVLIFGFNYFFLQFHRYFTTVLCIQIFTFRPFFDEFKREDLLLDYLPTSGPLN